MQSIRRILSFSLAFRLTLISFLLNIGGETSSVFLPLFAKDLGASRLEIGLIAASSGIFALVSSFLFGRLSDMNGRLGFIRAGLVLVSLVLSCIGT